jgi:hypothetical protein
MTTHQHHQPSVALQPSSGSAIETIEALEGTSVFPTPRIHAVAVNATEMAEANEQIRDFLRDKIGTLQLEKDGIGEAASVASKNGWKTDALDSAERRLMRQILYYKKLLAAVNAGYTIVPNMPCDQFAIRVNRKRPSVRRQSATSTGSWDPSVSLGDEKEEILPPGEGRYVSPNQMIEQNLHVNELPDGKKSKTLTVWPTGFDTIEFPFAAAVPVVMNATQAAMSLKLFDRIGLVPQQVRRDADPIVLGQIVLRQNRRERVASFLIAWHLDLRTL